MNSQLEVLINRCNEIKGLLLLIEAGEEIDNDRILAQVAVKVSEFQDLLQEKQGQKLEQADLVQDDINAVLSAEITEEPQNDEIESVEETDIVEPELDVNTENIEDIECEEEEVKDIQPVDTEVEFCDEKAPITVDLKLAQQYSKDLKKAFTLNDRFRFKRELFGNSDNDFADALNLVSAMQSLTEAEEYFYSDLGWDPESEEVQEFMSVIINHFS